MRRVKNLKEWQEKVLKRDNYTCQECGAQENLVAHHIKSQFLYPRLKLRIDNGVTLCKKCHASKEKAPRLIKGEYDGLKLLQLSAGWRKEVAVRNYGASYLVPIPKEFLRVWHSGQDTMIIYISPTASSTWLVKKLQMLIMRLELEMKEKEEMATLSN